MNPNKITVLSELKDTANYLKIPAVRKGMIEQASEELRHTDLSVNSVADLLHPGVQYLKVAEIIEVSRFVRTYRLVSDPSRGTAKLACFRPGQYLSVTLRVDHAVTTLPLTICSSPRRSLDDEYLVSLCHGTGDPILDYVYNTWQVGTAVTASAPLGRFWYQPLRDSKKIVGIASGMGVTPFVAMARAIADGSLDADLLLIYSCRKKNEAYFMDGLGEIAALTTRVKIVYVFSDERVENCERGFITKAMLEKYLPHQRYSVFISGPTSLYSFIAAPLSELKLERKFVRFGMDEELKDAHKLPDFPAESIGKIFLCKVVQNGEIIATVPCPAEKSLLTSLEADGITLKAACRSGECGFCRSKLTLGNVYIPHSMDYRRLTDTQYGIIHPCCSFPMSDLTLVI